MKAPSFKNANILIISGWISLLAVTSFTTVFGQNECKTDQYLKVLPAGLELKETTPQKYLMTSVYYNKDIYGKFFNKVQVSGEYTRGFDDGTVKWNNVRIAESNQEDGIFPEGLIQEYMEDFSFKPQEDMVNESAFTAFPQKNIYEFQVKNLVWDMMGFETFSWMFYDSLKLNEFYAPAELKGKIDLAGSGYFENKNIQLMLAGITTMHGEICAVIQYLAMDNPLEIDTEFSGMEISMKGRSHYWGNVLISLEDKQIEQAILFEDVIMKMEISGVQNEISNIIRDIKLNKLN